MSRNLIVCFDGTNNQFGAHDTNVVRLVQSLERFGERQIVYYDPGVGTLPEPGLMTQAAKRISELFGLAFGVGLVAKIERAYAFLMHNWQPGDRVFLFGFSRGAYTRARSPRCCTCSACSRRATRTCCRTSCGCSAARGACDGQECDRSGGMSAQFRNTFARDAGVEHRRFRVHFVGVWDTVSSVGWIWDPVKFLHTAANPSIATVRHAVAIDERRSFFRRTCSPPMCAGQDLQRAVVSRRALPTSAAVTRRVTAACGASPFTWMLDEAKAGGLAHRSRARATRADAHAPPEQPWAEPQHESLTWKWWPAEFFPKLRYNKELKSPARLLSDSGAAAASSPARLLHRSVMAAASMSVAGYAPRESRASGVPRQSVAIAIILIDTRTSPSSGPSRATERTGGSVGKNFAYSSFRPAKSPGRASSTCTSTTSSSVAPAARRMFSQLISAWRVCSWIVGPATLFVCGSRPGTPVT